MDTTAIKTYTASLAGVGTGTSTAVLTDPLSGLGPPRTGKILRIEIDKTSGPATLIDFRLSTLTQGVRTEFTVEPFPVTPKQPSPSPVPYGPLAAPTDLLFSCETDDATDMTDLDIRVEIEGPF